MRSISGRGLTCATVLFGVMGRQFDSTRHASPFGGRGSLYLLIGVVIALVLPWLVALATTPDGVLGLVGFDFNIYRTAVTRWLAGDGFYLQHQLAGTYTITNGDVLYPPTAIYLFLPFLVLPPILWWLLPLVVIIVATIRLRPSRLGLAVMAACLLPPIGIQEVLKGNPVLWVVAFESLALTGIPVGPLVLLKASLFPFALIGIRRRGWFIAAGLLILATLPLAGLVPDWIRSVTNSDGGLAYSIKDVPLMLAPLAAWVWSGTRGGSLAAPTTSPRPSRGSPAMA